MLQDVNVSYIQTLKQFVLFEISIIVVWMHVHISFHGKATSKIAMVCLAKIFINI